MDVRRHGVAANVDADLSVDVRAMSFRSDAAHLRLILGRPTQPCSIRLRSVSDVVIERPPDVAVSVKVASGATKVRLDDRWFGAVRQRARRTDACSAAQRRSSCGDRVPSSADSFTIERST